MIPHIRPLVLSYIYAIYCSVIQTILKPQMQKLVELSNFFVGQKINLF